MYTGINTNFLYHQGRHKHYTTSILHKVKPRTSAYMYVEKLTSSTEILINEQHVQLFHCYEEHDQPNPSKHFQTLQ